MTIHQISRTAIKQIYEELPPFEQQARAEMKAKGTRALGIVRLNLIKECRRWLEFLDHRVKDFEDRHREQIPAHAPRSRIA
jgi:hypothetical protein